ncbi:hypothetical protein HALLA_16195 [Halostagnicola larsenii XH-48]|uniref:Uncharacterized protein n=1 Tax=Halostagnicola larsenii XH-48 TaxID=797299 RepID=W0JQT2_9EURY|nr:hypothetical protein HALLA_16195 [Halostagnicola larsenii XH-48]
MARSTFGLGESERMSANGSREPRRSIGERRVDGYEGNGGS